MPRFVPCCITVLLAVSLCADSAWAIVIEEPVTPASARVKDGTFSIKAEKGKDGLIHFAITYRLPRTEWLVTDFEVRDGETLLAISHTAAFSHEESASYEVAVSPRYLADAKFDLSSNAVGNSGGRPVALPGGMIYRIKLETFAKDAAAATAD
jgi:hypothetical protein